MTHCGQGVAPEAFLDPIHQSPHRHRRDPLAVNSREKLSAGLRPCTRKVVLRQSNPLNTACQNPSERGHRPRTVRTLMLDEPPFIVRTNDGPCCWFDCLSMQTDLPFRQPETVHDCGAFRQGPARFIPMIMGGPVRA